MTHKKQGFEGRPQGLIGWILRQRSHGKAQGKHNPRDKVPANHPSTRGPRRHRHDPSHPTGCEFLGPGQDSQRCAEACLAPVG